METNESKLDHPEVNTNIWLPPVVLSGFLALFLIYLLLPGTLLYPTKYIQQNIDIEKTVGSSLSTIEDNLKKQIDELEKLAENGVCTDEGYILQEELIGLYPPNANTDPSSDTTFSILPPSNSLIDPNYVSEEIRSISDLLNKTAVFVVNKMNNGEEATGTGFFISEDLILTNQHVVEDAENNTVEVAFGNSEDFFSAQIIKISERFEESNQDYAVLRSNNRSPTYLKFAKGFDNLNLLPVVSAGFPGDVIESLFEFDAEGSGLAFQGLPLFNTNGVINAVQPYNSGGALVMHSADISQGNSGGPLVNGCGEIIGINTFIFNQPDTNIRTLNIALRADGVEEFLEQSKLNYHKVEQICAPRVIASE